MSFKATTTTAALPTPNTEVAFGSLANQHNYFDAYVDFLANNSGQKVQLRIYATSSVAGVGVRSLVAQSDWLIAQIGATPVRAIQALKYAAGTLFELQVISDSVCGNIKASLVGYEAQENFVPQDVSVSTAALAATETIMATINNPHSYFDASVDTLAALNCKVRWSLYATAGTGGVRARVAQFDMPASIANNQKSMVLESIGPIGANKVELTSQALEALPSSPNVKAQLSGFDPIVINPSTANESPTYNVRTVGAFVNQSLVAYDVSAANNNGVLLVEGDVVLLNKQNTLSENGPWVVGTVAAGLAPLSRPSWFKSGETLNDIVNIQVSGEPTAPASFAGWSFSKWIIANIAGGNIVVDTSLIIPAPAIIKGKATLVAGSAIITLQATALGAGGSASIPTVANTTSAAPVQAAITGGGASLTITDPLGGVDTIAWTIQHF